MARVLEWLSKAGFKHPVFSLEKIFKKVVKMRKNYLTIM